MQTACRRRVYGTSPNSDVTTFFGGYRGKFFHFFFLHTLDQWRTRTAGPPFRQQTSLVRVPCASLSLSPRALGATPSDDPASSSSPPPPPRRRAFTPRSGALDSLSAVVVTVMCEYAVGVRRTAVLLLCWRISLGGQGGAGGPCQGFPLVSGAVIAVVVVFLGGQGGGGYPCCGFPLVSGAVSKIVVGAFDEAAVVVEVRGVQVVVVAAVRDQPVVLSMTER